MEVCVVAVLLTIFSFPPQVQTDDNSCTSSSSSGEDDSDEVVDDGGRSSASPLNISSNGNGEALHDAESGVLREIEALANSALQVPIRASAAAAAAAVGPPKHGVESSNRNSATSLDSGRGSAYANSSDGGKMVRPVLISSLNRSDLTLMSEIGY